MDEAKAIKPNLDYPAALTSHLLGFDAPTFMPIAERLHRPRAVLPQTVTSSTAHLSVGAGCPPGHQLITSSTWRFTARPHDSCPNPTACI
ncbi:hypothetical protein ABIE00_005109 [Arthrobacter sp. OAP107]